MFKKLINWLFPRKPKEETFSIEMAEPAVLQVEDKTIIHRWIVELKAKNKISTKLYNSLYKYFRYVYLEDISMRDFMQYRGHGIKAWEEFSILRKKYLKTKKNVK